MRHGTTTTTATTCLDNLHVFINRTLFYSPTVTFNFIFIGDSVIPIKLVTIIKKFPNAIITNLKNRNADLCSHAEALEQHTNTTQNQAKYTKYFFSNCGARGPYYGHDPNKSHNLKWLDYFTIKLNSVTKAVGSTINCEVSPHVQSYAIALDHIGIKYALKSWKCFDNNDKLSIILSGEIGLSQALLEDGYNIASTTMYHGWDFRNKKLRHCGMAGTKIGPVQNPTACFSAGCRALDPCELVFVKYGGDVQMLNLLSNYTIDRVRQEDYSFPSRSCDNSYGWMKLYSESEG